MKNVLLAVCAFAIALVAVELVLRTTHLFNARVSWTQPDPWIGWRFTPGAEYWYFQENDHAIEGRINAAGWRERKFERAGATRVAVVGDSYVEALQVELDSTFVAVAERAANPYGPGAFEFMNFGRSGMGPAEERVVIERDVLAYDPDVVVLVFTPSNDVASVNPATAETSLRPFCLVAANDSLQFDYSFRDSDAYRFRERVNPFKQHSALLSLLSERYNAWQLARNMRVSQSTSASRMTREQSLMTAHPDSLYLANYALAKLIVTDAARLCAERGVQFVLMSVPMVYEDDEIARLRDVDASFDANYFDRDLAAMSDSSGIAFVALTEAFSERFRGSQKPLHWAHWNYEGHRLVGNRLADVTRELGIRD